MKRLFILFVFIASPAMAQQVTFAWDPHPEAAQIAGFTLYQSKTSGAFSGPAVATFTGGTLTTGSIPQPALGRYYFVLRAITPDGIESDNSNEVTLVLKPKAPRLVSAVQTVAMAPIRAVKAILAAGKRENLRITR